MIFGVQIAVQEPPLIPTNLTVVAKTSTSLHLRWEPQGQALFSQTGEVILACWTTGWVIVIHVQDIDHEL